jgi:hypothetical protein
MFFKRILQVILETIQNIKRHKSGPGIKGS